MEKILRKRLFNWYQNNKRKLPWRESSNPYLIWLSEIILQQTRIEQGLPYYVDFTRKYPNVFSLANAYEQEVLNLWQGLGYYTRARNLHATAKKVAFEMEGNFPDNYEGLKKLKGIGDYTASAISSIAFDEARPVIDGNVARVIARVYGIQQPINSTEGQKAIREKALQLLDPYQPGDFNQAMMDFGALQCTPQKPLCLNCPWYDRCYAAKNGLAEKLPIKEKKLQKKIRYFHYLMIENENGLYIKKRIDNDIWHNLYDLPLIETNTETYLSHDMLEKEMPFKGTIKFIEERRHQLTHRSIKARFYEVFPNNHPNSFSGKYTFVSFDSLKKYPFPRLIEKFLKTQGKKV